MRESGAAGPGPIAARPGGPLRGVLQAAAFVGPASGGIRTTLDALATGYAAAGVPVVQIVPGARDAVEEIPGGRRIIIASPSVPGTTYRLPLDRRRVRDAAASARAEVLELHDRAVLGWMPRWAAEHGLTTSFIAHERLDRVLPAWCPGLGPGAARRLADRLNARLAHDVDHVIATTRWAGEEFARLGVPVHTVPLGVDTELFRRQDGVVRAGDEPVRIVAAVRLSREKDPGLLLDLVRRLATGPAPSSVTLTVAGEGPLRAALARRAAREGLPVEFLGHLPRPQLAALLAGADVVVAPGPHETFGLAALEALACGTAVVVRSSSALPEVVGDAGTAVADAAEAADAVRRLAAERRRAPDAVAHRSRARATDLTWPRTVAAMLAVHALGATGGSPTALIASR